MPKKVDFDGQEMKNGALILIDSLCPPVPEHMYDRYMYDRAYL